MTKLAAVLAMTLVAGCVVGEDDDPWSDDALAARPDQMRLGGRPIMAAKWWNPLQATEQAASAGLELPQSLQYAGGANKLCNLGVEALFVRKGEPKIMFYGPDKDGDGKGDDGPCGKDKLSNAQCQAKINERVADALVAIRDSKVCQEKRPTIYLMHRQQLVSDAKIDEFAGLEIKGLIDTLKRRGVDKLVKGLAIVESHLGDTCQVKKRTVQVAKAINAKNDGWLLERSLFVGGAGLGAKFKDLDNPAACDLGLGQALNQIEEQAGSFSFIYKHFDNGDTPGSCGGWKSTIVNNPGVTREQAKSFLLDGCPGLADLRAGIQRYAASKPLYANVTFWGDEGDGITNIPGPVRNALNEIFVTDQNLPNLKHAAFDRLFTSKIAPDAGCQANEDNCKHLIEIDGQQRASLNPRAFDIWNNWN